MGEEGKRSAQGARVKYFFNWMIRRCKRILIGRGLRRVGARVFEGGKSSGWLLDVNPWIAFEINGTTRLTPTRTQSAPRRIRVLANKSITASSRIICLWAVDRNEKRGGRSRPTSSHPESVSRVASSPEGIGSDTRPIYATRPILYRFSLLYERNAKGANTTASASR